MNLLEEWPLVNKDLLLLGNGTFDRSIGSLIGFNKDFYLKGGLSYNLNTEGALLNLEELPLINKFLDLVSNNNGSIKKLLVYFIYAVIFNDVEHQKYLELVGPGGTGKSTFINLIAAIIGLNNTAVTELKRMETNRFETYGFLNKKLICIMDSSEYHGDLAILKSILGGDLIRMEEKGKPQITKPLKVNVIVASNEVIRSNDMTSGVFRRRVLIPFINKLPQNVTYINILEGNPTGLLVPEIPLFIKFLLSLNREEVLTYIKGIGDMKEYLDASKSILASSNPLLDFLLGTFVNTRDPFIKINIKNNMVPQFSLYNLYLRYCKEERIIPLPNKRFIGILGDVLVNIWGCDIGSIKDTHILGLGIKIEYGKYTFALINPLEAEGYVYKVGIIVGDPFKSKIKMTPLLLLINKSDRGLEILVSRGPLSENYTCGHIIYNISDIGRLIYDKLEMGGELETKENKINFGKDEKKFCSEL